jgi:hypothetical protein
MSSVLSSALASINCTSTSEAAFEEQRRLRFNRHAPLTLRSCSAFSSNVSSCRPALSPPDAPKACRLPLVFLLPYDGFIASFASFRNRLESSCTTCSNTRCQYNRCVLQSSSPATWSPSASRPRTEPCSSYQKAAVHRPTATSRSSKHNLKPRTYLAAGNAPIRGASKSLRFLTIRIPSIAHSEPKQLE